MCRVNIRGPVKVLCSVNKSEAEWDKEEMVHDADPFNMWWHEGGGCKKSFAMHPRGTVGPYLQQLLPKFQWRAEAEEYLRKNNQTTKQAPL